MDVESQELRLLWQDKEGAIECYSRGVEIGWKAIDQFQGIAEETLDLIEGCAFFSRKQERFWRSVFCIVCYLSSLVDLLKLMTSKKLQMPIVQLKLSQLHVPIWFIPPDRLFHHHVDPGLWTIENSSVSNLCQSCTSPTFVGWTRAGPRRLHNGHRGAFKA